MSLYCPPLKRVDHAFERMALQTSHLNNFNNLNLIVPKCICLWYAAVILVYCWVPLIICHHSGITSGHVEPFGISLWVHILGQWPITSSTFDKKKLPTFQDLGLVLPGNQYMHPEREMSKMDTVTSLESYV